MLGEILLHSITVIEISVSIFVVLATILLAFLLPRKISKLAIIIAPILSILFILFFAIRPYWVGYQVSKKIEKLNQYLVEKYPHQEWTISRHEGRQYNPYHFEVEFKNEKGWTYTYLVENENNICQTVWTPPEGKFPDDGKHFESKHCE